MNSGTSGIRVHPAVRIPAVTETVLDGQFAEMADAVLATTGFTYAQKDLQRPEGFLMAFQIALFANTSRMELTDLWHTGQRFQPDLMATDPPMLSFFNRAEGLDLLNCLKPDIRGTALMLALTEADSGLIPCHPILPACEAYVLASDGWQEDQIRILDHLVLRGRFGIQKEVTNRIREAAPAAFAAHKGWRCMMCGRHDKALAYYDQVPDLLKNDFLTSFAGLFYLFALLKSGDRDRYETGMVRIDDLPGKAKSFCAPVFPALRSVFADLLGLPLTTETGDAKKDPRDRDNLLLSFFRILVRSWTDPEEDELDPDVLRQIRDRAADAGHAWIEAEACRLLASGFLSSGGEQAGRNRQRADALHQRLGTVSITGLVPPVPSWEKTLNRLMQLSREPEADSENAADPFPGDHRLIWRLSYNRRRNSGRIAPRLQKRAKNGGWTAGRAVALKVLYDPLKAPAYMTEQDRNICGALRESRYGSRYGRRYFTRYDYKLDQDAALAGLVGHPLIFLEDNLKSPVALTSGRPGLILETGDKGLRLALSPAPDPGDRKNVLIRETPTRFKLVSFSDKHRQIAALLGQDGLFLPENARTDASRAVTALSSLVRVESDTLDAAQETARQVESHATPHVHIFPWQDGISLEIWVRPFGGYGSYFPPGKGGSHVLARQDNETVRTARNLEQETARVRQLTDACPGLGKLEPLDNLDNAYQIGDPEQALELLLALNRYRKNHPDLVLSWPKGETLNVETRVSFDRLRLRIHKDRDWFCASGHVTVGKDRLLDLKALTYGMDRATGRFIPLDHGTFIALTRAFREKLMELKSFSHAHGDGLRFSPLAGIGLTDLADQAGELNADQAWQDLRARFSDPVIPQVPSTFRARLRNYQLDGFRWLARLAHWQVGACLADDMGLGKTVQALAAVLLGAENGPGLVVAPLSVTANWVAECRRFAPTLVPKIFGPGDRRRFLDTLAPFDLVITTYGLLQGEAEKLAGVTWQAVVLDEAQAIKNRTSKRSKAAMKLNAGFRLITTGTPVENNLEELWTLFRFINPGLLGSFERFRKAFILPLQQDAGAADRLKRLIRPFILRRLKTDVLRELPAKTEITLHVEMTAAETALYESLRLNALENIGGQHPAQLPGQKSGQKSGPGVKGTGRRHLQILAELTRLRQFCCHPSLVVPGCDLPGSKLTLFLDTVADLLQNRHKILVFSQFVGLLKQVRKQLEDRGISFQYLDGATPAKTREKRINAFQGGRGDLFLISLKAGGAGLNLTAADYVIHLDPWWNPAVEDQASDRAHRIGQTRPVTVYRLVVKGTIEEKIRRLHREKRHLADTLLAGTDAAARISTDELLALLAPDSA